MAKKISDYAAAAAIDGSELLELVQAGVNKKGLVGALIPPGYIDGLMLQWISGTALTVTTGSAYIQGLGRTVRVSAPIAKAGLALNASSWYHVYLWLNGTNADVEIVTTAPSAVYNAEARSKAGDSSRRYLGSVRTDSAGAVLGFTHYGNRILYDAGAGGGTPFRVLSAGAATTMTAVLLSAVLPVTSEMAVVSLTTNSTSAYFSIAKSTTSGVFLTCPQAATSLATPPTISDAPTPNQAMAYRCNTSGGAAYIDVLGYIYGR